MNSIAQALKPSIVILFSHIQYVISLLTAIFIGNQANPESRLGVLMMPQGTGSTKIWHSLKSRLAGRSRSRKRTPGSKDDEKESPQRQPQKEPEPLGLHPIDPHTPREVALGTEVFDVDIIAIHGLNGTAFGTWSAPTINQETHEQLDTNWIRDFLPKDLPGSRLFTYSYDSKLLLSKSKATVDDFALKLLRSLKARRGGQEHRPIIFITHSLGGIVCKQALILAQQDHEFNALLDSTLGIVFFGTPHRGAHGTTDVGIVLGNICDTISKAVMARLFVGRTRTDLLESLKANSPDLRRITDSFSHICRKFQILTIYETKWLEPLGKLVSTYLDSKY